MTETQKLPLSFGGRHATSDANPLLGKRQYEIRTLSHIYLPENAEARIDSDILKVDYVYDTQERAGHVYQDKLGFSIQFGRETQRILSLAIEASSAKAFRTKSDLCTDFLKKQFGSASQQRHHLIIADTLIALKTIVLDEYFEAT